MNLDESREENLDLNRIKGGGGSSGQAAETRDNRQTRHENKDDIEKKLNN